MEESRLESMEHSLPKERKPGPAKHHPLHELHPGHLAFCLPIAMNERSSGQDSRFVSLKTVDEALEILDTTSFHLAHP